MYSSIFRISTATATLYMNLVRKWSCHETKN